MTGRSHITENTKKQPVLPTPAQGMFQSRPFVVQPQTEERSEQPDLKTALQRAERYGHRLDRIKSIEPPVPAPIPQMVQAKLTIGQPGDRYEQEADRVADQVVNSFHAPTTQRQEEPDKELQAKPSTSDQQRSPLSPEVQREVMPEEEDLQTKSILQCQEAIGGGEASTDLESAINRAKGGGQPLDADLQKSMGQAMGADFSGVRVHTDSQSDQLTQSIQAKAFTTGQDVFFRSGEYNPGSRGGQELIAHELTHVVQQNGGVVQRAQLQRTEEAEVTGERMRTLDQKDIEGYQAVYETIELGLQKIGLDVKDTLIVGVGRSPQVLVKYMELKGISSIYLPISGLSGKTMKDYQELTDQEKQNRDSYFKHFIEDNLNGKKAILTIDIGVSGSSNKTVYNEIKNYLSRQGKTEITVKMATISPFQNTEANEMDTSAVKHTDNIFKQSPLDEKLRGIHRLLKVQFNSIDKNMAFTDKFHYGNIDKENQLPKKNPEKEAELKKKIEEALETYGKILEKKQRKNPDKPFNSRLLFEKEVKEWRDKQNDMQWQAKNPVLTKLMKIAYILAAISSGAAINQDHLDPKYWKHIKL